VRQSQPLLPRRGGKRICALFRRGTGLLRGGLSIPKCQTCPRRRNHPDHQLAKLLAGNDMARLPLLGRDILLYCITSDIAPAALDQPAGMDVIAGAIERLFGPDTGLSRNDLRLPAVPCLREVYAALVDTDRFHTACGRISASYAW